MNILPLRRRTILSPDKEQLTRRNRILHFAGRFSNTIPEAAFTGGEVFPESFPSRHRLCIIERNKTQQAHSMAKVIDKGSGKYEKYANIFRFSTNILLTNPHFLFII